MAKELLKEQSSKERKVFDPVVLESGTVISVVRTAEAGKVDIDGEIIQDGENAGRFSVSDGNDRVYVSISKIGRLNRHGQKEVVGAIAEIINELLPNDPIEEPANTEE